LHIGFLHVGFLFMMARVFVYRVIDIGFLTVGLLKSGFDLEPILARFCQNVQTFLQETMLKHIFIEVFKEYDNGI
jgi:hypothetical protein